MISLCNLLIIRFTGLLACITVATAFHAAVKTESNQYCIILDSEASGTITYSTTENTTETFDFKIPELVTSGGKCLANVTNGTTSERLTLAFYPNNITPKEAAARPWTLDIIFKENPEQSDNAYSVYNYILYVEYYPELFENASLSSHTYTKDSSAEVEWHGEKALGFTCSKTGLSFTNDTSIVFEHLKVAAFGLYDSANFTDTQGFLQCKLDVRTSDLVPIVVGACLAGLVIVVLIAYLIGRARAKRQG